RPGPNRYNGPLNPALHRPVNSERPGETRIYNPLAVVVQTMASGVFFGATTGAIMNVELNLKPAAEGRQAEDLVTLANRINSREKKSRTATLLHVRQQGEDLLKAKALCGHGPWTSWLKEKVEFSPEQARRYMRFAKTVAATDLDEDAQWQQWQQIQ